MQKIPCMQGYKIQSMSTYLDSGRIGQIWVRVTKGENGDKSDKRI